jgi:uncharacterized protein
MPLSMFQASVPVFLHSIAALDKLLDKATAYAAERKIEPSVLLQARLAPDMFPLTRQVQLVSDFAKNTTARLAGLEPPKMADTETTFDELKQRLAKTTDFLQSLKPDQVDGSEDREISFPVGGRPLHFKGQQYLFTFGLPNFYFHATTAYDILRHNGLPLQKRDFLGLA